MLGTVLFDCVHKFWLSEDLTAATVPTLTSDLQIISTNASCVNG